MISSDGTNKENIAARKGQGFGTVKDIVKMLDNMCLVPYLYQKAVVLRESMLVETLLTCSEAWYNLTKTDMLQLEQVDKSLWCSLLEVSSTVPYDLVCLELGLEPLRYIIMKRKLIYLQHILKQKDSSLVKNFLNTQLIEPQKKDWAKTVQDNLKELEINYTMKEIEEMPKQTYKNIIKKRIKDFSLKYLLSKRNRRNGKGREIEYSKLAMQNYILSEDLECSRL